MRWRRVLWFGRDALRGLRRRRLRRGILDARWRAASERGKRARALIDWAIGPVWEANHVWLIFVLVMLWTAFSEAFASIMSTLFIPLCLAAARDRAARRRVRLPPRRGQQLGAASGRGRVRGLLGAHALLHGDGGGRRRVRARADRQRGGRSGHELAQSGLAAHRRRCSSPPGAYLAAVFLVSDARRFGDPDSRALLRDPGARRRGRGGRGRRRGDLRPARGRPLPLRRPDERGPAARAGLGRLRPRRAGAAAGAARGAASARSPSAPWWR